MFPTEPLQLHHSWPILDPHARFAHGLAGATVALGGNAPLAHWQCDLATNLPEWSDGVYDIFGLPRGITPDRATALACYREESRVAMERLRAHALRHRRGFTLDARLRTPGGTDRWMRLTAAPQYDGARAVRLAGTKQDVTHLYAR
ncbi:hypothetical protein ASG29_11520 [Sphingomonas sp. Leaf412]|uniref:hypothetical protein n=1 Tax=Sphingomonas sp. Leaf412 TaxID=1736370 RepID=UPI00070003DF|nr:hypothetical protein [Sphingomonas sp. Leaf412]KQT32410.1 hypothetical protein ASG29_11520 [Sphingomonas sp. Leaf412]